MISEKAKSVMQEIFEINEVPDDISQTSCDTWDSLKHLALVVALEEAFNTTFEPEEIEKMTSLQNILKIIGNRI